MKGTRYATYCSVLMAALAMAACGGGSSAAMTATQPASGTGPAELAINNLSAEPIYYIYMSPSGDQTWGPDLLGTSVLPIGGAFTISNIAPGYWDVRVVDSSGNRKEWYNQFFDAGGVYWVDVSSDGWTSSY